VYSPRACPPTPAQKIPVHPLDKILADATATDPPPLRLPHPPSRPPRGRTYPIDLLKVDVEGYDVVALTGAPATLAATRLLLWECHAYMQGALGGPGTTHVQAAAALAAAGFESYKLGRHAVLRFDGDWYQPALDVPDFMGWHNCLAVRGGDPLRGGLLRQLNGLPECVGPWGLGGAKETG